MSSESSTQTPILIVGAGPTGLVLALGLARRHVAFRLIDAAPGPGQQSRAMVVQARTLEFYRQFGLADQVVGAGVKVETAHLREAHRDGGIKEVLKVDFSDLGKGQSPYPFLLAYPQDDHERWLVGQLQSLGVTVEWDTRLERFSQDAREVHARLIRPDGSGEALQADYICGCDGVRSVVRETLGLDFTGGTYEQLYYVADVTIEGGFERDLFFNLGENTLALMLPVRSRGVQRLIGLVPSSLASADDAETTQVDFEDIRAEVERLVEVKVDQVNWFSTYRVSHRVAGHFCKDRAFLLGDAGHVHSPAGAQGMNTGIGDAINLAWKLAQVLDERADSRLLATYESERIAFARRLVASTDAAFKRVVASGTDGALARRLLLPLAYKLGTRWQFGRYVLFRMLSQIGIHYGDSALSHGRAGRVAGGDRLPWVDSGDTTGDDNFASLVSLDWQLHVYGRADTVLAAGCASMKLPLQVFEWSEAAYRAGLARDAAYLIRPDGYVALATEGDNLLEQIAEYAQTRGLRFAG
jgi:2-polyprenyl-6-methoxyphenol hydroxylase-like FAD-dependent oxidoreductase